MRTQNTDRLINFRPLYPKAGLPFYRTGSPHYWDTADIHTFNKDLGITHYYDLRTEFEQDRCRYCTELKMETPIKHVSSPIDLTGDAFLDIVNASALDYANYYLRMLPRAIQVADQLQAHAEETQGEEKLLFGCAAGKDRTGLVAMVLLKRNGVDDASILEDYMESAQADFLTLKYFYNEWVKDKISPDDFVASMRPKPYTLEIVLDHINTHKLL
jgi:hypothetical protein